MTRWSPLVNRRDFVHASALGIVAFGAGRLANAQNQPTLDLGVMASAGDAADGTALGVREAQHAAQLFNRRLVEVRVTDVAAAPAMHALVFAGDPAEAGSVADACTRQGIVFLNAIASGDQLRRERCTKFTFHVAASDAMRRDALASAATSDGLPAVEMWHSSLERFGAGQLNDRYRSTGRGMTSAAWAGWMAVKIAWEAFLRSPGTTGPAMAAYLESDLAQFDGHKGMPLSFRKWDHQLRQPLYLVAHEGDSVLEVPSLSRPDVPMRELLDSIGDKQGTTKCA